MKKQPIKRIGRIEKSIHDIYLIGVEMEVMNGSGSKNHKDKEIICALGAIQRQIDLVIADLQKLKKVIEVPSCDLCDLCGNSMMQSNIHGWICTNHRCEASTYH